MDGSVEQSARGRPMSVPGSSGCHVFRICSGICRLRTGSTALSCSTCVPTCDSACSSSYDSCAMDTGFVTMRGSAARMPVTSVQFS